MVTKNKTNKTKQNKTKKFHIPTSANTRLKSDFLIHQRILGETRVTRCIFVTRKPNVDTAGISEGFMEMASISEDLRK